MTPRSAFDLAVGRLRSDRRLAAAWLRRQPALWDLVGRALQRFTFSSLKSPASSGSPPSKIGFVVWRYPLPSETFIGGEVRAMGESGVDIEVIAEGRDDPPMPDEAGIPVTYLGPLDKRQGGAFVMRAMLERPWTICRLWLLLVRHHYPLGNWWGVRDDLYAGGQMAAVLRERGRTRVHAGWADAFAMRAFVAARMLGLPFSVQARASEVHRFVHRPALPDRIRFARFVVTNSRYNERHIIACLGGSPEAPRVHVVYDGVDLDRFRPTARTRTAGATHRLLSVGRIVEPKGFRYLLEAIRLLRDRGLAVQCDIIGGAEETATWVDLHMRWVELRLQDHVRFLGARSSLDVIAALDESDMFVLPCVRGRDGSHDITPNALLEAMAMQLPVISTTSGAVPELVTHGVDGWLVPPEDGWALAGAIERLLHDPTLAGRLGLAARRTVEQRFDLRRNAAERAALLHAAIATGAPRSTGGAA